MTDSVITSEASQSNDFFALLQKQEDLLPELAKYIEETDSGWVFLKHPLLVSVYTEQQNAYYNASFKAKKQHLDELLDKGDYELAIWFHERAYRTDAFLRYGDRLPRTERANMLLDLWTDQEFPYQHRYLWLEWFRHLAPYSAAIQATKAKLAGRKTLTVYRGMSAEEADGTHELGLAWTTKHKVAQWFAKRWKHRTEGRVLKATIPVQHVFALNDSRNEAEVILDPDKLQRIREPA